MTLVVSCAVCGERRVLEVREGPREDDEDAVPDITSVIAELAAIGWTLPGPHCGACR